MTNLDIKRIDTICAPATPLIPSALAVVRVSGKDSSRVLSKVFRPRRGKQKPFVATLGDIIGPANDELIDEGICTYFLEGKSFTGESCFELSVHGSPVTVKRILEALQTAGCRLAQPGEFSLRAVLTGKMDLCAAEAVSDLIHARSSDAAKVALRALKGGLLKILDPIRETLVEALCEIEARLDFPDEDLGEVTLPEIEENLHEAQLALKSLLKGARLGRRLTEGARVVLFGAPNVGKSTLLNTLIGEDRALIHDRPGTTRDVLESDWVLSGVPVILVDVAGVRAHVDIDPVEAMGISKARQELQRADVILWLRDGTMIANDCPKDELKSLNAPVLKLITKADLCDIRQFERASKICVSALSGFGIKELKQKLSCMLKDDVPCSEEVLLSRARQKEEVEATAASIQRAKKSLQIGQPGEVIASEIRQAGYALDRLLGKTLDEDVLDSIFQKFCIGK